MRHGRKRPARKPGRRNRVLARLGIRGKLNLLLLPPLIAVVLVSVPFVLTQVTSATSAGQTAEVARQAQKLGELVTQLQRERLLTGAFVATSSKADTDLMAQRRAVDNAVNDVRASLGPDAPDELAAALVRTGSLQELRLNALTRGVSLDGVARTYHAVIGAVIDALRLVPQTTSDAEGTRQLTALEALLRANEENSLRGMALIVAAVSPEAGQSALADATQKGPIFTERFVQQADPDQAARVVRVDQGDAARKIDELAGQVADLRPGSARATAFVAEVLATADSQAGQRRLVQGQVTGQITDAASSRASGATQLAWTVGVGAALMFALVVFLAIAVSRSIVEPLRRLTAAATSVADLAGTELVRVTDTEAVEEQVARLATIEVSSSDELGSLAIAFNRVQSTASELVERQAITRRNVSLMFANVAKRTQNLVGRQLALVDELERNEQDTRLLASLYRLDHLSTRLRRNADNLLVVSGTRDEARIAGPIELSVALRSALAEIEDYQRVRLGVVGEILLSSSLGSDLVLVFAELMENATSFSPPGAGVEVDTMFLAEGGCLVSIVDHGIGMNDTRLAEENRRLVERERLEVAPTSVLGLFVVGRLARRHSLNVELLATPRTGGVTARLTIPAGLFSYQSPETAGHETEIPAQAMPVEPIAGAPVVPPEPAELPMPAIPALLDVPRGRNFRWFRQPGKAGQSGQSGQHVQPDQHAQHGQADPVWPDAEPDAAPADPYVPYAAPAVSVVAADAADAVDVAGERGGLRRRVKGAQLPGTAAAAAPVPATPPYEPALATLPVHSPPAARPRQDPAALRDALDGFQSAFENAAVPPRAEAHPADALPAEVPQAEVPQAAAHQPAAPPVEAPVAAPPPSRAGMVRRVPGAQLAPGLRKESAGRPPVRSEARHRRDPASERASFDAFTSGLAKAGAATADSPDMIAGRDIDRGEESRQ